MNVLLVNPPNYPYTNHSILAEPVDVLQFATIVEKDLPVTVVDMDYLRLSDLNNHLKPKENIVVFVLDYQIPLHSSEAINRIFDIIKGTLYPATFILISKLVTIMCNDLLDKGFDYLITFNAETTLPLLVRALNKGNDVAHIPNLIYKAHAGIKRTPQQQVQAPLHTFPPLNRALIKEGYMPTKTIITSRGCINHCLFCPTPYYFGKWQHKGVNEVITEIKTLIAQGVKQILFLDDNLLASESYVWELCHAIKDLNADVHFGCLASINCFSKTLFEFMYEVGFRWVHFGIESGSQKVLDCMQKPFDVALARQIIPMVKAMGYRVRISIILNYPRTNPYDLKLTQDFIHEVNPHELRLHYLTYRYHTPLYDNLHTTYTNQYIHLNTAEVSTSLANAIKTLIGSLDQYLFFDKEPDWNTLGTIDKNTQIAAMVPIKYGLGWE